MAVSWILVIDQKTEKFAMDIVDLWTETQSRNVLRIGTADNFTGEPSFRRLAAVELLVMVENDLHAISMNSDQHAKINDLVITTR